MQKPGIGPRQDPCHPWQPLWQVLKCLIVHQKIVAVVVTSAEVTSCHWPRPVWEILQAAITWPKSTCKQGSLVFTKIALELRAFAHLKSGPTPGKRCNAAFMASEDASFHR